MTTLDSRIKIRRGVKIQPTTFDELIQLISNKSYAGYLQKKLSSNTSIVTLSPNLSSYLIERIASIKANRGPMRTVAESFSVPEVFDGPVALQEDAVRMALEAFGLSTGDQARSLELIEGRETSLVRVSIKEDSVIEVKRDGSMRKSSIITPIDHFEKIRMNSAFRGPRNGLIVSYERLSGCYLRENAFLDLIRSGYIGCYSVTTKYLKTLIEEVLKNERAVVAAIQSAVKLE
jgi:hypothetical protein